MEHPKRILDRYGLEPKITLGQNFLVEDSILQRICRLAELTPQDQVLEIGPGTGSLTDLLADRAGNVMAVELDRRLEPILKGQLKGRKNIQLIFADILDLDPGSLFSAPYKVVANVPYYITGAIFKMLLSSSRKPSLMVLTVQREVADRLSAGPGDMSLLAVSVQLYGSITTEFTVRAGSFWPRPDVDSAVVRFRLYERPLIEEREVPALMTMVRQAYGNKRKQLQKSLRVFQEDRSRLLDDIQSAGVDPRSRPETLAVEEWLALYQVLSVNIPPAADLAPGII